MGETTLITGQEKQEEIHITGSLTDFVRNYLADQSEQYEGKVRLLLLLTFLLSSTRAERLRAVSGFFRPGVIRGR
jgi:hypothetical protein